jgi:predicted nucleic acid-binding protein
VFVLDTDVISHLRRPDKAHPSVLTWASSTPFTLHFISCITLHEIERGILAMERKDAAQGGILRSWMNLQILARFAGRILPIDIAVAQRCARLHVPDAKPERDAFIAATALVHGMTVVTRNVRDFASTGVEVLNPWEWRDGSDLLHVEIEHILRDAGDKWMTSAELAREVNRRGRYEKKEGSPVDAKQIAARTGHPRYRQLFEFRGEKSARQVRLKRGV